MDLRILHLTGTPGEMGRQHGVQLRESIQAFVSERLMAGGAYLSQRGHPPSRFLDSARASLAAFRAWDARGYEELAATAEAAGVSADELFAAGNYTDLRDVAAHRRPAPDAEGCTAVIVVNRDATVVCGQTWDLNPSDVAHVVGVHRVPSDGSPATFGVTVAGCPAIVGLNSAGLAWGTTNLKANDVRLEGVPYLCILSRIAGCSSRAEAASMLEAAPRIAAHSYWLADACGGEVWEVAATHAHVRRDSVLVQTNHAQAAALAEIEEERPSRTSTLRLAAASSGALSMAACSRAETVDALVALFSDRRDGPDSICRWPEDATGTTTNAVLVAEPALGRVRACRGPADRGQWIDFAFDLTGRSASVF